MTLAERLYRVTHRKAIAEGGSVPYYWKYSIFTIVAKPVRKFFSAVIIPTIPFSGIRVWAYRRCGYRIGKNAFIGMRCYLDDMCYDKIIIGNNVTISYGVYFACHGRKQGHNEIVIGDGAYIGMNASIVARTPIEIGKGAVVGACSLVNKSIAAGTAVAGIPAKSLETRSINGGGNFIGLPLYRIQTLPYLAWRAARRTGTYISSGTGFNEAAQCLDVA